MLERARSKRTMKIHEPTLDLFNVGYVGKFSLVLGPQKGTDNALRLQVENDEIKEQMERLQRDRDIAHAMLVEMRKRCEITVEELKINRETLESERREMLYKHEKMAQLSQELNEEILRRIEAERRATEGTISKKESLWMKEMDSLNAKLKIQEDEAQWALAEQKCEREKAERDWVCKMQDLKDDFVQQQQEQHDKEQETTQRLREAARRQYEKVKRDGEIQMEQLKQRFKSDSQEERTKLLLGHQSQQEGALREIHALRLELQSVRREGTFTKGTGANETILPSPPSIPGRDSPPPPLAGSGVKDQDSPSLTKTVNGLRAKHATELSESRRLTDFFKRNNERVSREVRELRGTNRVLREALEVKEEEMEDCLARIEVLEAGMGEGEERGPTVLFSMPLSGEWS